MAVDDATSPEADGASSADRLPLAVKRELSLVKASAGVRASTVKIAVDDEECWARISFDLEMETPVEHLDTAIQPVEPIEFVYQGIDSIGLTAPALVLSGRQDFPRNLGHLNPVAADHPVSVCLARSGLQPIYDRFGIEGVMVRLRTWMRDAMTGGLMADGWEPVPFLSKMPARGGLIDPAVFQEIAAQRRPDVGWTTGAARITAPDQGDYVVVEHTEYDATVPPHLSTLSRVVKGTAEGKAIVGIPWIFLWSSDDPPISDPVFGFWTNYRELREGLRPFGLAEPLDSAIGAVLANGCTCQHAPGGRKTLVILIGIWRPIGLADNIFGLSDDPIARRLEIKAYTLETAFNGNLIAEDTKLRAVVADSMPSPHLFRWTTGSPALAPAGLIGYGALGQAIADHLLRAGIEEMSAIDADNMLAHNLARHGAELRDLYRPNVDHLSHKASALTAAIHNPRVRVFKEDARSLSDAEMTERLGRSCLVIDATADKRVRGRLSRYTEKQIIRTEIFHRGRLGVEFVTGPNGNPNLFDLYYLLCFSHHQHHEGRSAHDGSHRDRARHIQSLDGPTA